jgi:DNA processing protein
MSEIIPFNGEKYPVLLKSIKDPPNNLYVKGTIDFGVFENCLAVVGSRRMSTYGKKITQKLVSEISCEGVTVVSGFMYGVDAVAHEACLNAGGKTIAVMPCGIDLIHPEYQHELYNRILSSDGLILSEFGDTFPPLFWTYPRRNRIIAGLSRAVLVVEAGLDSGSLITAGFAKVFNRPILAVPGNINSETSLGTLNLIKQGAKLVVDSSDVLEVLQINHTKKPEPCKNMTSVPNVLESGVVALLKNEPLTIDDLLRKLDTSEVSLSVLSSAITLLVLRGILVEEEGKYYVN